MLIMGRGGLSWGRARRRIRQARPGEAVRAYSSCSPCAAGERRGAGDASGQRIERAAYRADAEGHARNRQAGGERLRAAASGRRRPAEPGKYVFSAPPWPGLRLLFFVMNGAGEKTPSCLPFVSGAGGADVAGRRTGGRPGEAVRAYSSCSPCAAGKDAGQGMHPARASCVPRAVRSRCGGTHIRPAPFCAVMFCEKKRELPEKFPLPGAI